MKPELILALIALGIYMIGMILKRNKPELSKVFRFTALGLMLVSIGINIYMKN